MYKHKEEPGHVWSCKCGGGEKGGGGGEGERGEEGDVEGQG